MGERMLSRRALLRDGATGTVAILAAGALSGGVAVALADDGPGFLNDGEMRTLRALVDVFVPADRDPGAVAAGCAEAIDALLGAFAVDPPRIYAGAPYSDRAGSPVNDFARFLTLDPYEERAWRLRIEGGDGPNGAVTGWRRVYRDGLAALGGDFAARPAPARELALRTSNDPKVKALVDVAWPHTWQFLYGAPEYGGNKDLAGWRFAAYQGDVQPRGWTREEVESGPVPGTGLDLGALGIPTAALAQLAALAGSPEAAHVLLARGAHSARAITRELRSLGERA